MVGVNYYFNTMVIIPEDCVMMKFVFIFSGCIGFKNKDLSLLQQKNALTWTELVNKTSNS